MGDRLRAGIPSRHVTSQLGQLSLACPRGRLIELCCLVGGSEHCIPVSSVDTRRHLRFANRHLLAVPPASLFLASG